MYKVISTGSKGNAVIYHNSILVDCGVPFVKIKPFLDDIQIILLTHNHKDHINDRTLKKIHLEKPIIRIGCCEWMFEEVLSCGFSRKNIDVYEIGELYDYVKFQIVLIKLYHNVLNCGYRILKDNYKIIHATDTNHLEGIEAPNYDLYAIEHNYDEDTINDIIEEKKSHGEFSYEQNAINRHLSEQQAQEFIYKNKGEKYKVLRLHESTRYSK